MATEREKLEAISEGVFAWFADHPISIPETIESGVYKAVYKWFDDHETEIIDAIAERVAAQQANVPPPDPITS